MTLLPRAALRCGTLSSLSLLTKMSGLRDCGGERRMRQTGQRPGGHVGRVVVVCGVRCAPPIGLADGYDERVDACCDATPLRWRWNDAGVALSLRHHRRPSRVCVATMRFHNRCHSLADTDMDGSSRAFEGREEMQIFLAHQFLRHQIISAVLIFFSASPCILCLPRPLLSSHIHRVCSQTIQSQRAEPHHDHKPNSTLLASPARQTLNASCRIWHRDETLHHTTPTLRCPTLSY
ncbi:hypothetical protein IWZ00DRAFT_297240 [Phyllosticta capitalensis]